MASAWRLPAKGLGFRDGAACMALARRLPAKGLRMGQHACPFHVAGQASIPLSHVLQDNVALIAVLEAIEPAPPEAASRRTLICVANTHIHANPELNDVKLWQVHTLLKGLEKIAARWVPCCSASVWGRGRGCSMLPRLFFWERPRLLNTFLWEWPLIIIYHDLFSWLFVCLFVWLFIYIVELVGDPKPERNIMGRSGRLPGTVELL